MLVSSILSSYNYIAYHQTSFGAAILKEAFSVLMLWAPAFLFTLGSSALLERPRCGLWIWLSLLAIFNPLFWVYANCFHEKTDKTRKYLKSAIFVWCENGRQRLLAAQSINTEKKASVTLKGPSQPLLCFCLHLGRRLTKLLEISTKRKI